MTAIKSESETPQPEAHASIEIADGHISFEDSAVSVEDLPKVIVCFDLNTLSHRKLKAIASDLKLPGYSRMTKAELCEALSGL